jgi:transposase
MSTSFIYHALGVHGYRYLKTFYKNGNIFFHIYKDSGKIRCPNCKSRKVIFKGTKIRYFKTVPIGKKPIILITRIQRIQCKECFCLKQVKLGFADPKKTYTRSFARYALELLKFSTINDVAHHLNISWDTIKEIQKDYLHKHFSKPKLTNLCEIAIDEISIGLNHKYFTIVLDLKTGAVVFIGDGKGADSLKPFWEQLLKAKATIKAVAIDMSPAYIRAVRKNLADTVIVFDHFHIIKYYNDKLSKLRRHLYYETKSYLHSQTLKGLRWILLKNPENLDKQKNEKERLEKALNVNKPLATAYYLKEDLRQMWNQETKENAEEHMENWIAKANASGVKMLIDFAKTLASHRTGILAYYDYKISTGPLEGTNNKIKTMQRQSYGFRDKEFYKLKILALHQSRYALIG